MSGEFRTHCAVVGDQFCKELCVLISRYLVRENRVFHSSAIISLAVKCNSLVCL